MEPASTGAPPATPKKRLRLVKKQHKAQDAPDPGTPQDPSCGLAYASVAKGYSIFPPGPLRLHVPPHKRSRNINTNLISWIHLDVLSLDLSPG